MADISLEELKRRLRAQRTAAAATLAEQRAALESASARARPDPRVLVEQVRVGACDAEWLKPDGARPGTALLYLHGGAFVAGSCTSHRPLASALALAAGRNTLTLEYRLAPEHPWPAAEEDAFAAYEHLSNETDDVVLAGDSAGGNLAMRLLLRARDQGVRLPGAVALFSPWIDLDVASDSATRLGESDPTLDPKRLRILAALYRGGRAGPRILEERLEELPPIIIQAGDAEILYDDAVRLYDSLMRADVAARLDIWPGAFHVWQAYFPWLMEAREAIARVGRFLNDPRS